SIPPPSRAGPPMRPTSLSDLSLLLPVSWGAPDSTISSGCPVPHLTLVILLDRSFHPSSPAPTLLGLALHLALVILLGRSFHPSSPAPTLLGLALALALGVSLGLRLGRTIPPPTLPAAARALALLLALDHPLPRGCRHPAP